MEVTTFLKRVLGCENPLAASTHSIPMPRALQELHACSRSVDGRFMDTFNVLLSAEDMYEMGEFVVFATENQCVTSWAYKKADAENDSPCYQIVSETDEVFPEDDCVRGVVLALLCLNLLSSELFGFYEYVSISDAAQATLLSEVEIIGAFSALKAAVWKDVVLIVGDLGNGLQVDAGSRTNANFTKFTELLQTITRDT